MGFTELLTWTARRNSAHVWATAGLVFAGAAVLLLLARRAALARLGAVAARTSTDVDDFIVDLVRRTRAFFLALLALYAASLALVLPIRLRAWLATVVVVGALLQTALWGNGVIAFWLRRYVARRGGDAVSRTTIAALGFAVRFALWVVILLVVLGNMGVNVTALVAGLGITGVAVALAVQNILGDLLAALSIVLDKPFEVGDFIVIDTFMGTVQHVGLKSTRVASLSGEQIIFSNADLLKSRIRNYQRMAERRVQFAFGLRYDTPPEALARVPGMLREIIAAQPQTRFDRAHLKLLGPSTLDFEVVYFVVVADYTLFMDLQQTINLEMLRRFEAEGIHIGFPSQHVQVSGDLGVRGWDSGGEGERRRSAAGRGGGDGRGGDERGGEAAGGADGGASDEPAAMIGQRR